MSSQGRPGGVAQPRHERSRGQALVEFALVSTMMLLLLVIVTDFGLVFYYDNMTSAAASEGARVAAAGGDDTAVDAAAVASAPTGQISAANVNVSPACTARKASTSVTVPNAPVWATVTASYTWTPITPLTKAFVGNTVTFTRSVSQRMRVDCQ
jgi:Flp pilus assembly protein TadG